MAYTSGMELNERTKGEHDSRIREVSGVNSAESSIPSNTLKIREVYLVIKFGCLIFVQRFIRFPASVGFLSNLQLSWVSIAVSFQAGLFNGGPTALVYGTILCWFGTVALAASLGEMASITPTVGAQYRWSGLYAPPGVMSPAFFSLIQGWITVFVWMCSTATPVFLLGTQIQGLIILNNPNYVPHAWHGTLLAWAVLAIPIVCNIISTKILEPLEILGGIANIVFFVVIVLTLAILSPRNPASFVFETTITGLSGWENAGIQWCLGLLPAAFALSSFDGVIHMSDEVRDAPRKVPWAMVLGVAVDGILAFAIMITILFCLGPLQDALDTPTGYPIIQVFYVATKSKAAATALMSLTIFSGLVSLFNGLASTTRLTWAFAKDNGLPFSNFFSYVHPTLRIPTNALGLSSIVMMLIMLINLGSTAALEAILSLSTVGLYLSYLMPITFFMVGRWRGTNPTNAPFRLGRWGTPINLFALVFGIFMIIFLPFPSFLPVTWATMNYSGPVLLIVIFFAFVDWFTTGKRRFTVPTSIHGTY